MWHNRYIRRVTRYRALEVNSSLEELNIINDTIGDNGIAHIAKSLQKNNTLKVLHVGMEEYNIKLPVPGFTDAGVLSLARSVATNESMKCLSIRWHSTDPDSTLKMMADSVKNSNLKTLSLYIGMCKLPLGEAPCVSIPVAVMKANEWYHGVEVGGKEFIQSLQDSHLKLVELKALPYPICRSKQQWTPSTHSDMRKD